jgi:hypothetical protein
MTRDLSKAWDDYVTLSGGATRTFASELVRRYMAPRCSGYFTSVGTDNCAEALGVILVTVEVRHEFTVEPAEITCPFLNIGSEQAFAESGAMRE